MRRDVEKALELLWAYIQLATGRWEDLQNLRNAYELVVQTIKEAEKKNSSKEEK